MKTAICQALRTKTNKLFPRCAMKRLMAVSILGLAIVAPTAFTRSAMAAADQRGPVQRVVSGRVLDGDTPVKGAVVYLQDKRTMTVKSYYSMEDGTYRFGQLSANTDYELWAVLGAKKTKVKNISSFDTKSQFTIDLKF